MGVRKGSESLGHLSDEALMARYADGDADAFEALFVRYEQRAYSFYLRRTGSKEQSQDLYQELFLRIHRARDRYDPKRPFAAWFYQVANHLLIDDWRRSDRRYEVSFGDRDVRATEIGGEQRAILRALERTGGDKKHAAELLGISRAKIYQRLRDWNQEG